MTAIYLLFLAIVTVHCACGEVFAIKDAGNIGYFDANNRWKQLRAKPGNKRPIQISSSSEGLWVVTDKHDTVFKKESTKRGSDWVSMKRSFTSLAATHTDAVFGVSSNGKKMYQCPKKCKSPTQWKTLTPPPTKRVDENDPNIGTKIREKLKMKALQSGKLQQLTAFDDFLYGLDEIGHLWKYAKDVDEWQMIPTQFALKWIHVTQGEDLYVINVQDNKPYFIDVQNNKYHPILDANDFEAVVFDPQQQRIWALNYYQQLFYLNDAKDDWVFVDEGFKFISYGQLPDRSDKQEL